MGDVSFLGTPEVRETRLNREEFFLDLRLEDEEGNWAVMVGITIPRDRQRGEVGATTLGLRVEDAEMIGCSGLEDGEWDFDCKPELRTVEVADSGDGVTVDFEGWFTAESCHDYPSDAPADEQGFEGSIGVEPF